MKTIEYWRLEPSEGHKASVLPSVEFTTEAAARQAQKACLCPSGSYVSLQTLDLYESSEEWTPQHVMRQSALEKLTLPEQQALGLR